MSPADFRVLLFFGSFGLIQAAAYHYGGAWAAAATGGVFIFLSLLRK